MDDQEKALSLLSIVYDNEGMAGLCEALGLPVSGRKDEKQNRVMNAVKSWDGLTRAILVDDLRCACAAEGLPTSGAKPELVDRLLRAADGSGEPPTPPPPERLEATRENVLAALGAVRIRRVRSERAAQEELFDEMHARFGELTGREKVIGGYTFTRIDIDIGGTFAIEVKNAGSLFNETSGHASEVERLLGQLVLYGKLYRPENIIVALVGEVEPNHEATWAEIRRLVEERGSSVVSLRA